MARGRGNIAWRLPAKVSERQMIETLNGKVDMASCRRRHHRPRRRQDRAQHRARAFGEPDASAGEKTAFSELAGTYTIANGVAKNQDLRLVSRHLRATARARRPRSAQLDYTVAPKIGGARARAGAAIKLGSLEMPIRIEGPWDKPELRHQGPGADHWTR